MAWNERRKWKLSRKCFNPIYYLLLNLNEDNIYTCTLTRIIWSVHLALLPYHICTSRVLLSRISYFMCYLLDVNGALRTFLSFSSILLFFCETRVCSRRCGNTIYESDANPSIGRQRILVYGRRSLVLSFLVLAKDKCEMAMADGDWIRWLSIWLRVLDTIVLSRRLTRNKLNGNEAEEVYVKRQTAASNTIDVVWP